MSSPTDIKATMLLCDSAQSIGGKLYVLGGGWSILRKTGNLMTMALAVKLSIPWSRTNEPHDLEARLVTEAGDDVLLEGQPVRAAGAIEVGRPPGIRKGTPLDAAFVLTFQNLSLDPGGYVWELRERRGQDAAVLAREQFHVVQ
jgi:hypothetical protein